MNKILSLSTVALVSASAGAVLVWIVMQPTAPTNIFISLRSPAAAKSEQLPATPARPAALPQTSHPSAVAEARLAVQIQNSAPTNLAPTTQAEPPPASDLRDPDVPPPAVLNSVISVQQVSIQSRAPDVPVQSLSAISTNSARLRSSVFDDALSFALEAADPYVKEGFIVREDYWGGDLAVKSTKAVVHQLFKGNEYWFWLGSDTTNAELSIHVYDQEGQLAEIESWEERSMAAARVIPKRTGKYYLIVEVEKSPLARTRWAMAYGFR